MLQDDWTKIYEGTGIVPKDWRYSFITLDLTIARVNEKFDLAGTLILFKKVGDMNTGFGVKLDATATDLIPAYQGDLIHIPSGFDRLYFTNNAGVSDAEILIGKNVDFRYRERATYNTIRNAVQQQVVVLGAGVAAPLPAVINQLADRITMSIFNNTGAILYIGDATVTNLNGYIIPNQTTLSLDIEEGVLLYGFSVAGGNVHLIEGS